MSYHTCGHMENHKVIFYDLSIRRMEQLFFNKVILMTNKKNVCIKISLIFRVNPSKMVENGIFEVDREKVQTQDKRH